MRLQLQYVFDQKDPLISVGFSEIHFVEIDLKRSLDLNALIRTLKAPHKLEDAAIQIFSNHYYLNPDLPIAKQFEENNVREYR
jgi:hypothetical protein